MGSMPAIVTVAREKLGRVGKATRSASPDVRSDDTTPSSADWTPATDERKPVIVTAKRKARPLRRRARGDAADALWCELVSGLAPSHQTRRRFFHWSEH